MRTPATTRVIQLGYGKVGGPLVHLAVENCARIELETGVHLEYAAIVRSSSVALGNDLALRAAERGAAFDEWTPRAPGMTIDVLDPVFNHFGLPDTTKYVLIDVTATAETGPCCWTPWRWASRSSPQTRSPSQKRPAGSSRRGQQVRTPTRRSAMNARWEGLSPSSVRFSTS